VSMSHQRRLGLARLGALLGLVAAVGVSCLRFDGPDRDPAAAGAPGAVGRGVAAVPSSVAPEGRVGLGFDVYAHTRAGMFSPTVRHDRSLVYVPNLGDGTVSVIDQRTLRVIDVYGTGAQPQHVVPSWDLKTLWVNNNAGNSLSPIDPGTGRLGGRSTAVADPYNLYFTPDGRSALVMAEALHRIDFRDPHTFGLQHSLDVGGACAGVNHADFSPDGNYLIATCEFSGQLIKVDLRSQRVVGRLTLNRPGASAAPQDVKIEPAGRVWYVADMNADGVWEIDGDSLRVLGFLPTGPEAHGLYLSRDGRYLYVANRGGHRMGASAPYPHGGERGSVSVIDVRTRRVTATWRIPGGGTPDMGNVSADGGRLWLSGRRSNVVYVFDTGGGVPARGRLITRIPVGTEPHGLCVWPQPGRYSLGHTGILR
jgi:YVTN family beta-propeller protein